MGCREAIINDRLDMALLVDIDRPECVFKEARNIVSMILPSYDFEVLRKVFTDTAILFKGKYPGYRECNTGYHDLKHTTDVFLTMARLIHGFYLEGYTFSRETIGLGLVSALMHDTGYIQTEDDNDGTGSKYTLIHVERSIQFMKDYFRQNGFSESDYEKCRRIVLATNLSVKIDTIPFESEEERIMGKIIFMSDLLGQMSDRVYLERLLFLFKEFNEGNVCGYAHEDDFLEKTLGFYELIRQRLETEMGYEAKYMRHHFSRRWNIEKDLYLESTWKNIIYLKYILECCKGNYRDMLKRGGIVSQLSAC